MNWIYKRRGGPLLRWDTSSGRPPFESRAAETRGLGDNYVPTYVLPGEPEPISGVLDDMKSMTGIVGMGIGAFHGYKRTKSVAWAAAWAIAGAALPLFTGIVAVAQGFAQPKKTSVDAEVVTLLPASERLTVRR